MSLYNEPTNDARAMWALNAIKVFAAETGLNYGNKDDLNCAIQDLITDLLHLAHNEGFDAKTLHDNSLQNFELELTEENEN